MEMSTEELQHESLKEVLKESLKKFLLEILEWVFVEFSKIQESWDKLILMRFIQKLLLEFLK